MTHGSRRQKGQNAERDVCALLQPIVEEVWDYNKVQEPPQLCRNLQQTQAGGFDIAGLPWLALEVKHHKQVQPALLADWWNQTLRQAGKKLEPVLFYRGNRQPFRVRFRPDYHLQGVIGGMTVDVDLPDFIKWFRWRTHFELIKSLRN